MASRCTHPRLPHRFSPGSKLFFGTVVGWLTCWIVPYGSCDMEHAAPRSVLRASRSSNDSSGLPGPPAGSRGKDGRIHNDSSRYSKAAQREVASLCLYICCHHFLYISILCWRVRGLRLIDTSRRGARGLSCLYGRDCAAGKVRASASEVKGGGGYGHPLTHGPSFQRDKRIIERSVPGFGGSAPRKCHPEAAALEKPGTDHYRSRTDLTLPSPPRRQLIIPQVKSSTTRGTAAATAVRLGPSWTATSRGECSRAGSHSRPA